MRRLGSWQFGGAGVAISCLYLVVPAGLAQDAVYELVGVLTLVAMAVGIRRHRPAVAHAWWLTFAAQALWITGDAVDSVRQDVLHDTGFPSLSDVFYLCAYPVFALALHLMARSRRGRRDTGGVLDSATFTASFATLSWVLFARPTVALSSQALGAAVVGVAYPAGDILLAAGIIRLLTGPGERSGAFRWLLGAVGLLVAADSLTTLLSLWTSASNSAYDILWLLSYVCWGMAALDPSMASLATRHDKDDTTFTRKRLGVLAVAVLVGPGILAVEHVAGTHLDVWPVVLGSSGMFVLVVARMNSAIHALVVAHRERERLQHDLTYQATHDSLTELPNRAQAVRSIEAALSRAQRSGYLVALMFIDLDGFKGVNDTYGHAAGDAVLTTVAARLRSHSRAGDLAARLGGDEFVVMLENCGTQHDAVAAARRIIDSLCEPVGIGPRQTATIGASVGLAFALDGDVRAARLMQEADAAVYRVKGQGGNHVECFDESMRQEVRERLELETALARAIKDDELQVAYQPVVDLASGNVTGFEALVRWHRPGHGVVMPAEFIPLAEESALICDVDAWVLRSAVHQASAWNATSQRDYSIAVNVSARHLRSRDLVTTVSDVLAAEAFPAHLLVLEITETALIEDHIAAAQVVRLHELGVIVSIDDFGTGYSSISRLRDLNADIVKTDRSFLDSTDHGAALLEYTVKLAHALGISVVVEGVENPDQLELARSLGCGSAQGFHLSTPMPASDIDRLIHEQASAVTAGPSTQETHSNCTEPQARHSMDR